jgi:pilus assembly protein Flp/PilA
MIETGGGPVMEACLMVGFLKRFATDERGATAIEYGLVASLIAVAIITSVSNIGKNVSSTFSKVAGNMTATK